MSWDIYIQDIPAVASANDIPVDFRPQPIGDREELIGRIIRVLPMAERQDSDWLFAQGAELDLSMQFHMEDATQVRYIVVHIHGGAQSAASVAAVLNELGLRAMDTATGELFDGNPLEEGL